MRALIRRLTEPSTYAALAALLAVTGVPIDGVFWELLVDALVGLFALLAFFLPEPGVRKAALYSALVEYGEGSPKARTRARAAIQAAEDNPD